MKKKVTYIPTLQEYMKKRRVKRAEFLDIRNCLDCDYFRRDSNVCLWGNAIRKLSMLKTCPVTHRDLQSN